MSERNFAFLVCPPDLENPRPTIDWLSKLVDSPGPGSAPIFVAVATKFKAPSGIGTFKVGANHPTELARLTTHANWANTGQPSLRQNRDAQALFCLHQFAQAYPDFDQIVLITETLGDENDLMLLLQDQLPKPFHWLERDQEASAATSTGPIIFNQDDIASNAALNLALDMALSGAIYGLEPYSLETLLDQSARAAAVAVSRVPAGENG